MTRKFTQNKWACETPALLLLYEYAFLHVIRKVKLPVYNARIRREPYSCQFFDESDNVVVAHAVV